MKQSKYHYNASGAAVDEKGGFVSLKAETTEKLLHRKKLCQASLWRNRAVRPAQIAKGIRKKMNCPK
jgi:hypothetical protein